jgi:hypothetical protein
MLNTLGCAAMLVSHSETTGVFPPSQDLLTTISPCGLICSHPQTRQKSCCAECTAQSAFGTLSTRCDSVLGDRVFRSQRGAHREINKSHSNPTLSSPQCPEAPRYITPHNLFMRR